MFFRVPARVVTPIEERNEGEETSGGKSKIVSRDASVVGSNLGRGTRANPNPAYPESNFESFESDPLLSSPGSLVQGGIPRGRERERKRERRKGERKDGGGRTSRPFEDFKSSGRTSPPLEQNFSTIPILRVAGDAISEEQLFFSISVGGN